MVEEEKRGVRRVNRPRWEGGGGRYVKKLLSKKNWFQRKTEERSTGDKGRGADLRSQLERDRGRESKDELEPETVMFVPSTPNGELAKLMKKADSDFRRGTKMRPIKFIERAGVSLRDTLVTSNPWGDEKCGRGACFICRGDKGGISNCMKEGVLYSIRCDVCRKEGREIEYWGETGETAT